MPGLGAGHWGYILVLLVIVLMIWGPGKLPDIGSSLGRGIREFRKATSETRDEFHATTQVDATPGAEAAAAGAPAPVAPAPAVHTPSVGGGTPAATDHNVRDGDHTTPL